MKKLLGVAAASLGVIAVLSPSGTLARGGEGHEVPEVREPKVPEVKAPEVRVPNVPAAAEVKEAPQPREPPAPAVTGIGEAAATNRALAADVVATRSFDSRSAFLSSPAATRVGEGTESSVKLLADYTRDGRHCRDYRQTVVISAQQVKAVGTVCRAPDGSWGLVPTHGAPSPARLDRTSGDGR